MQVGAGLRQGIRFPAGVFLIFLGWSLLLTYPLLLAPFSRLPLGSEQAATVPLFNLWTLQWNIDQLVQGYPNYWDAPIFAPLKGTFAFSETQPLSALLAAPLWLGLQSPALAYNGLVILFLTLNGWFCCWLLRSWRVKTRAAVFGGLAGQSLPFVAQEMGVLQLLAVFGPVWSLLFLRLFLNQAGRGRVSWRTAAGLALGTPVTFFTCGYYGLFSLIFLPLALGLQLRRKHLRASVLGRLVAIALLAAVLSGPFLWSQQQRLAGYSLTRSNRTIESNSARLEDYGHVLGYNLLYGRLLGLAPGQGQRLFPGLATALLAVLGLWGRSRPDVKRYLVLAAALGLLLSLGLRLNLTGWLPAGIGPVKPYLWLKDILPGFSQLRSPFRFAAFVQLHLALLAGLGFENLGRWARGRRWILGLAGGLVLVELLALPLPLLDMPSLQQNTAWQNWLNRQSSPRRLVMLPFARSGKTADFEQTTIWMLESRYFQGEMVNGYSGFFPPGHRNLRRAMQNFPGPAAINLLRARGVGYVIVYNRLPGVPSPHAVEQYLHPLYHDEAGGVSIYALPD